MLQINSNRFLSSIRELATIGATPDGGVTRFALTEEDVRAQEWLIQTAAIYGLSHELDAAGNLFIFDPEHDTEQPPIIIGSHLDTVQNGGRYDGALGVLAGLEALIAIKESDIKLSRPIRLAAWSEEEGSRFKGGLVGSRAIIGEMAPGELEDKDSDGVSLADALRKRGLNPDRIDEVIKHPGEIWAYLELHIEQGAKLFAEGYQIGVVTGIVGIRRYDISVAGQANHAGTTPMGMRKDALVAVAKMVQLTEEVVSQSSHQNAVGTVGKLVVHPGGVNVIPGRVDFTLEVRDLEESVMDELASALKVKFEQVAAERGVSLSWQQTADVHPAPLAQAIRQQISNAAEQLGYRHREMPSGAGHDAQHLARICPTGMIFVPSIDGISHSPHEKTLDEDCVRGANVLLNSVLAIQDLK